MNIHKSVFAAVMIATILVGTNLSAQPGNCKVNLEKRLAHMKSALNLNEDQLQKIRKIGEKYRPVRLQNRSKIKALHQELRTMLQSDSPDRTVFKKKLEEIGQLKMTMRLSGFDQRQEVARILTTEQRTKWKELMQKRMHRMKGKRGSRCSGSGPF